jgi:hypothetical protein
MGYLSGNVNSDQHMALVLSHWSDATEGGILPGPTCIPTDEKDTFRHFVLELTLCAVEHMNEETRVALVITLLRYNRHFRNNHPSHTLVSIMDETAAKMGIEYTVVSTWGKLVCKAFLDLNAMQMNVNDLDVVLY